MLGDGCQLGSRMLRSLADDVESVTLVRECREMEEAYGTHYTEAVLRAEEGDGPHPHEMKKEIMKLQLDKEMRLACCSQNDKAPVVADIARVVGWEKLWDASLDEGPRCVRQLKRLVKSACHRCFNDACPCQHKSVTPEMVDALANMNLLIHIIISLYTCNVPRWGYSSIQFNS